MYGIYKTNKNCSMWTCLIQPLAAIHVFSINYFSPYLISHNEMQEAVFTAVGKKIIESCVGGYNGTIFA